MSDKGNDKESQSDNFNQPNINLDLDKEDNAEWSKYSTSIKGLKVIWYATLCCLRISESNQKTMVLDDDSEIKQVEYEFDEANEICNTDCANYCLNALYGLISHTAQLGNNTDMENFNDWNSAVDGIIDNLLENEYNGGNTYKIKTDHFSEIIAYCCSYSPYSRKNRGGFMTKQATETITSIFSSMNRGDMMNKNKGNWLDNILHLNK